MAPDPSPRRPTPSPNEEGEENLRSKRSSIMIKCSDGSEVIFVRPHRPRSGPYATSPPQSPSPPPGPDLGSGPASRPSPGGNVERSGTGSEERPGLQGRRNRRRPVSMPMPLSIYNSDIHAGQSHRSLPTYLHGRCEECGYLRGHSDICSIGNRQLFSELRSSEARPSVPIGGEGHDDGTNHERSRHARESHGQEGTRTCRPRPHSLDVNHSRPTVNTIPRSSSSANSENERRRTPQLGRNATSESSTHSRRTSSRNSRTPPPLYNSRDGHRSPTRNCPSQSPQDTNFHPSVTNQCTPGPNPRGNQNRGGDSYFSSTARYSIEAVISHQNPSSRSRHHGDRIQVELRELSTDEAHPSSTLHCFEASIRGGYGTGSGADGSRNRQRPRGGSGTGRSRSRDVLLRGLRRCCFALLWLIGGDLESHSSRRDAYEYAFDEDRVYLRAGDRRTRY